MTTPTPIPADAKTVEEALAEAQESAAGAAGWSRLWQLPALLASIGLFVLAIAVSMPRPKPDQFPEAMREIQDHIAGQRLDKARERLDAIATRLDRAGPEILAAFKLLNGDLVFAQHVASKSLNPAQLKLVQRLYGEAVEMGSKLDAPRHKRLAEVHIALGDDEQAIKQLDFLTGEAPEDRYGILRQIIRRGLQAGDPPAKLGPVIDRFLAEAGREQDAVKRRRAQAWAWSARTQQLLQQGEPDEIIQQLLRQIVRLRGEGAGPELAPLEVILAEAYVLKGEQAEASRHLLLAQQHAEEGDELNARILVNQARLLLDTQRDYERALGLFKQVVDKYPSSEWHWDALVGLGMCEAELGSTARAIERFQAAAAALRDRSLGHEARQERLASLLRARHALHDDKLEHESALAYLGVLREVFGAALPEGDVRRFAQTHEKLGEQLIEEARQKKTPTAKALANQAGWRHLLDAAANYEALDLALRAKNPVEATDSLWRAAGNYDRANEWERAIHAYQQYVNAAGEEDPRRIEAYGRLGMAQFAQGRHDDALIYFRKLVDQHPTSKAAHETLVPMAQALWARNEPELAKAILANILDNHPQIGPDSDIYRDALAQLGKYHHKLGEFEPAISRLDEGVKRYGDQAPGVMLRFTLADAYRRSVAAVERDAAKPMPEAQRAQLLAERARRLERAADLYGLVASALQAREADSLTEIEKLTLRNASFYRADAIFDLGRYEQAIAHYDEAANQWSDHPSSLMALIQIVNANCELGNLQAARVANQRAREQLNRIPEKAFEDETLPMSRKHWQDWLRWADQLDLFTTKAGAQGPAAGPTPTPAPGPTPSPAPGSALPRPGAEPGKPAPKQTTPQASPSPSPAPAPGG